MQALRHNRSLPAPTAKSGHHEIHHPPQVAPPDPDGTCSLGISVDAAKAAALTARTVIAEANPGMPRTAGDSRIPAGRTARFVTVQTPVMEYLHDPVGEAAEQIAPLHRPAGR